MNTCAPKKVLTALYALVYVISSGGETLAIKALNYADPFPLYLPGYTALLSNQMWLLMLPIYLYSLSHPNHPSQEVQKKYIEQQSVQQYLKQYFVMAILTFAITILRNLSLNLLPGSIFSLLISTSIAFNMALNYFILKKSFNPYHLLAAILCVCSAISISSSGLTSHDHNNINEKGVLLALGAAFFIAVMSVYQEHLQTLWSDVNFRIIEMTLVSSFIASILILAYSALSGELSTWKSSLELTTQTHSGLILVSAISVALPILKLLVRNSKYSTIQYSSSFFFEFVQASSALSCSVASILLFNEKWSASYVCAFFFMTFSFIAYIQAKKIARNSKSLHQKTHINEVTLEIQTYPLVVATQNPLSPSKGSSHNSKTMIESWQ